MCFFLRHRTEKNKCFQHIYHECGEVMFASSEAAACEPTCVSPAANYANPARVSLPDDIIHEVEPII